MLEGVTSDTLTDVGAADGTGGIHSFQKDVSNNNGYLSPASSVISVTLSVLLPATLVAVTVMV